MIHTKQTDHKIIMQQFNEYNNLKFHFQSIKNIIFLFKSYK